MSKSNLEYSDNLFLQGGLWCFWLVRRVKVSSLTANMSHDYNMDANALAIFYMPLKTASLLCLFKSFLITFFARNHFIVKCIFTYM